MTTERTPQDVLRELLREIEEEAGALHDGERVGLGRRDSARHIAKLAHKAEGLIDKAIAETPDSPPKALGRLIRRVEQHVDFQCGADDRYAFMEEVRVIAGDLAPDTLSEKPGLDARLVVNLTRWIIQSGWVRDFHRQRGRVDGPSRSARSFGSGRSPCSSYRWS